MGVPMLSDLVRRWTCWFALCARGRLTRHDHRTRRRDLIRSEHDYKLTLHDDMVEVNASDSELAGRIGVEEKAVGTLRDPLQRTPSMAWRPRCGVWESGWTLA